jgi:isopenicillin N synthase-like dioxygenase
MADLDIPVLNLADLQAAGPKRDAADAALLHGLGEFGLIHLSGHGIDLDALETLYADFIEVTERPEAEKAQLGGEHIWYQRGWTPPDTERAVVAGGQPDFKECYFAAPEALDPNCAAEYPQLYAANVWPSNAARFETSYMALGQQVHAIGLLLLAAAARALDLPEDTFTAAITGGAHVSRALRYLPLQSHQIGTDLLWGEEHTDFNLLTLLPGGRFYDPAGAQSERPDDTSGLYLRTRPSAEVPLGHRVRGVPPEGCMVAQVGQQLEILTGGRLLATPHEIVPPQSEGYTRCAFAHFMHLHAHQIMAPLPQFRTAASVAAYRPSVLAGTYALKTLVDIGLAPKDALQSLGYRHYGRLAEQRREEGRKAFS